MDLIALGSVLSEFFDGGTGPSHDELNEAFRRTLTAKYDPAPSGKTVSGAPLGKMKRVRQVFVEATDEDPQAGLALAKHLVSLLRANGQINSGETGADRTKRLTSAFAHLGFTLHSNGALSPLVVDELSGVRATAALRTYVDRINANPDDPALQVGSAKELDEAAARHVLQELAGEYATSGRDGSFPMTVNRAFQLLDMAVRMPGGPPHPDPAKAVQEALFELAIQINRLRNQTGTGHGRPDVARLSAADARLAARATALIASAMLDRLSKS
jgi:hypothetical protein